MRRVRTCELPGCRRKHKAKGMCDAHYQRYRKNVVETRICQVDGCKRKRWAGDYCQRHYRQWKRTGDPIAQGHKVTRRQ